MKSKSILFPFGFSEPVWPKLASAGAEWTTAAAEETGEWLKALVERMRASFSIC